MPPRYWRAARTAASVALQTRGRSAAHMHCNAHFCRVSFPATDAHWQQRTRQNNALAHFALLPATPLRLVSFFSPLHHLEWPIRKKQPPKYRSIQARHCFIRPSVALLRSVLGCLHWSTLYLSTIRPVIHHPASGMVWPLVVVCLGDCSVLHRRSRWLPCRWQWRAKSRKLQLAKGVWGCSLGLLRQVRVALNCSLVHSVAIPQWALTKPHKAA